MSRTIMSRGRALASLTTVLGLGLGVSAAATGPAQSAEPAADCTAPFPVSDVIADQAVRGLTVTSGTTPTEFTGRVIGVLEDGIAPDLDMIMMRLTSPEIDRVGGIWQGMSGSPVYAEDGRLIGAVAYGMSWGPSTVAGVTPFEDMDDYLAAPAATVSTVDVGTSAARAIARETSLTTTQASEGFSQLRMPIGVSGLSARRLTATKDAGLQGRHAWLGGDTYKMGGAAAAGSGPGAETIVPGGNLAASFSYGDVTAAGVGTATSLCGGEVVGFGHPMLFSGDSTMMMHPASALYIQEESLGAPFKMANLGAPVGTITDDRTTGISGLFGLLPRTATVTSDVDYQGVRSRTGSSDVSVPGWLPDIALYEHLVNHDRVIDGYGKGSELQDWTITGDRNGTPFTVTNQNRYASNYDITWASAWEAADVAWLLGRLPGVTIDAIDVDSDVTSNASTYEVTSLQQRRNNGWVTVGSGSPVLARSGQTLSMRAVTVSGSTTRTVPFSLVMPGRSAGSVGRMVVTGGEGGYYEDEYYYYEEEAPTTVAAIQKKMDTQVRNDQLSVQLGLETMRSYKVLRSQSQPQDKVVTGVKRVKVLIGR